MEPLNFLSNQNSCKNEQNRKALHNQIKKHTIELKWLKQYGIAR